MEISEIIEELEFNNEEAVEYLNNEYSKIRSGRVNPIIFKDIKVNIYDDFMLLNQISNIQIIDARTVFIKPFDKSSINEIIAAINKSSIGVNPILEEGFIRLSFPMITEETRIKNVKNAKNFLEKAKTKIRTNRENARKQIKQLVSISEDLIESYNEDVEKNNKQYNSKLEKIFEEKEKELLKI
ncbi:MAG: ribosome recycling factor [Mycoplasmataceae bacterium]|jgi:ribosome recycling factor|nr:ribosome recycling factor [Mycoplasmataceae bacterium]